MPAKTKAKSKLPQMRFHTPTGQAYVRLNGRMTYLGSAKPGNVPPQVESRFQEAVRDWLAGRMPERHSLTVDELALRYMRHAKQHYRKGGVETSEVSSIQSALRPLVAIAGTVPAGKFGPLKLQEVRERMIALGWARKSINSAVNRVRRAFRWAVSQELVRAEVLMALQAVPGLTAGRSKARESTPITAVSDEAVGAILPLVSRQVRAMIQLQRLTGMRPGEVVIMRGCDINTTGELWEYRPHFHKTEHHGLSRIIVLGPKAQSIVREFLRSNLAEYLFSPTDARREWDEARRESRKSPMTPSQAARVPKSRPQWKPRERYDSKSYATAIRRACERAFNMPLELRNVPLSLPAAKRRELKARARAWRDQHVWTPNQLRHTAATEIRRSFGLEAAQNVLGHQSPDVTLIYAERNLEQVRTVMERIG